MRINKSVPTSQSHICDVQYIFKRNTIYFLWEKLHLHGVFLAVKVIVSEAKYKQVFASCHKKAFFDFTSDNFNSQNDHEEEVFLPGKYISCRLKMFTECHVKQFSLAVCSKGGGGGGYIQAL